MQNIPVPAKGKGLLSRKKHSPPVSIKTLAVFDFVLLLAIAIGAAFFANPDFNKEAVIKNATAKQASQAIAEAGSIKWSVLIKRSDINSAEHWAKLPKSAKNIKISTASPEAAKEISAQPQSKNLGLKQRQDLALNLGDKIVNYSDFLLGDLENAAIEIAEVVLDAINPQIERDSEATYVDLAAEIPVEPVIEEPAPAGEETPAVIIEAPAEIPATETPSIETPVIEMPAGDIMETVSPSDSEVINQDDSVTEENSEEKITEEEYIKIEYETPAPEITEQETENGKIVTVSADEETETPEAPLTDVIAFTKIPEIFKVGQEDKIKIRWQNNGDKEVTFHAYDSDGNGKLDYVEWTVPHLSEQIFEIIFISKAWQMDSAKNVLEDIYDKVQAKDGNYASLQDGQYIRATFQTKLTNNNDITIYARPANPEKPVRIEIYAQPPADLQEGEQYQEQFVASFENIDHEDTYKVLLPQLASQTDVFDLKITGDVDIDFITDPVNWIADWTYRKKITISKTNVGSANLSNFPLLVSFTSNADLANALSTGYDVRFTDSGGTTLLQYERESWSGGNGSAATAIFWVQVPTVSYTANTNIYMYYGNANANTDWTAEASTGDCTNTHAQCAWDTNFKAIWHLPNGSSLTVGDSTSNANTGTNNNAAAVAGKIYGGAGFDGASQSINGAASVSAFNFIHQSQLFTASTWLYGDASSSSQMAIMGSSSTSAEKGFYWSWNLSNNHQINFKTLVGDSVRGYGISSDTNSLPAGTWYYVTVTGNGSGAFVVYVNGASVKTASDAKTTTGNANRTTDIGRWNSSTPGAYLKGNLDEMRISNSARTAGWVKFEYCNMLSSASGTCAGNNELTVYDAETYSPFTWTNGSGDGLWNTAANWYGGAVPGANDVATFNSTSTASCSINTNANVAGISIHSQYTLSGTLGGNAAINGSLDGSTGAFSVLDVRNPFSTAGVVTSFSYYVGYAKSLNFYITNASNVVQYISPSLTPPGTGVQTYTLPTPVSVESGWRVGVYWVGGGTSGVIPYNVPASNQTYLCAPPVLNQALSGCGGWQRYYSFSAVGNTSLITQSGSYTVTVGSSGWSQAGGTFKGGTAAITVSGNVSITGGTFVSTSGNLSVGGNWSNSGTFAANSGTVTFPAGTHTVSGATTFYNLALSPSNTITLPASGTQTISNNLSCIGSPGNIITINSSSGGTRSSFSKASGTVYCDYLSLQDSNATGGATWYRGYHTSEGTNNAGWSASTSAVVWTNGSADGLWTTASNWRENEAPYSDQVATFTGAVTGNPTINANIDVGGVSIDSSFGIPSKIAGNNLVTGSLDGSYGFSILDSNSPIGSSSTIYSFGYYASNTRTIQFLVVNGSNNVQYLSPLITPPGTGAQTYYPVSPISVQSGWKIGIYWTSTSGGTVPYTGTGTSALCGVPVQGQTLTGCSNWQRTYSIAAYTNLGTITQSGSNTITVGSSGWSQAGATFTGGSGAITMNGNFSITGGTFTSTSANLSAGGNWSNSGAFAANSGTVTFPAGTHTLTGATTFYNLTIDANNSVSFPASTTQTISNNFACSGTAGNGITLTSSTSAAHTLSKASGTVSCSYATISYSDATGGAAWQAYTSNGNVDGNNNSGWVFTLPNNAPAFTAGPSDGGVALVNVGASVAFSATASDAQNNNYYLAVCKTNSITAANNGAPACGGGEWCISNSTEHGQQATCNYQTQAGDAESNSWYAFVCDHNAASLCSSMSQGSGGSGSPFALNHAPSFSAISSLPSPLDVGAQITFSATASDADSENTVTLYVCKSNDFTGSGCGAAGEWCHSSASASNPSCNYTILYTDAHGSQNYYAYIIDNHDFASASNPRSSTFSITDESPSASSASINSDAPSVNLTPSSNTNIICEATVSDDNGYDDITTITAKLYRSGIGAGGEDNYANHYTISGAKASYCSGSGTSGACAFTFEVYFYADPTDEGSPYEAQDWVCQVTPSDGQGAGIAGTDTIEMNSITSFNVTSSISYGQLDLGSDTGTSDEITTITNAGNRAIDVQVGGYGASAGDAKAMSCSLGHINVNNEKYSTQANTIYSSKTALPSDSSPDTITINLAAGPSSTADIYWGIGLPSGGAGNSCTGYVVFAAVNH